jgi:hypothetical protein
MIAFKSCPRCRGDLLVRSDEEEVTCLQCGHDLRPAERDALKVRLEQVMSRKQPVLAA